MNTYTVTFTGDSPAALFAGVREFCSLLDSGVKPAVSENCVIPTRPTALPANMTAAQPVQTSVTAAPIPAPTPAQIPAAAAVPAAPAVPAGIPTAAAPTYTLDQLSRATCVLSDANRIPDIQALFAQFGIGALTDLQPAQYGAYATALRQMGVSI